MKLLTHFHFKADIKLRCIKNLLDYIREEYKIKISKACIAAAGFIVSKKDYVKITNSGFHISKKRF